MNDAGGLSGYAALTRPTMLEAQISSLEHVEKLIQGEKN